MGIFRRKQDRPRATTQHGDLLITQDAIVRMASHGRGRYDGSLDIWDMWPSKFTHAFSQMSAEEQARSLSALVKMIVPGGGWAIYGAEDLLGGYLPSPGSDPTRDELFAASLEFQRDGGVWWGALSIQERMFWEQRHPGETWIEPIEPPSRDAAVITPLNVGEERRITLLNRAADSKATYVTHVAEGRYVFQLDYPDDNGNRLRDDRDEADALYDLYWRIGRGMPFPGIWVDPELARFMAFPMPRL